MTSDKIEDHPGFSLYDSWDCGDRVALRQQFDKRKEIIRMAREANIKQAIETPHLLMVHELERFAALVAAAEREACAKVCEDKAMHCETKAQEAIDAGEHDEVSAIRSTAWQISVCAATIRARGQA